jgi:Cupin-like domain
MNYLITFFIFLIVALLYVHITTQYKKGEHLEIYEMDYTTNRALQDVCDIRQPVIFDFMPVYPDLFAETALAKLARKTEEEVQIYDTNDYWKSDDSVDSVTLPFKTAGALLDADDAGHFFSENNGDYLADCGIEDTIQTLGTFFRPQLTVMSDYDVTFGSTGAYTPLRHHCASQKLVIVIRGKLRVKMTSWKNEKYLYPICDYEKGEYKSRLNPWNPQEKYRIEMEKLKFLDFEVGEGYILYIPAYWWYSIQYHSDTLSGDLCNTVNVTYYTAFNRLAHLPETVRYFLNRPNHTSSESDVNMRKIDSEKRDLKTDIVASETENIDSSGNGSTISD